MLIARGVAAFVAGLLLALAVDPVLLPWTAPLGVAALSLATWRAPARTAALLAGFAGYVWFGVAVSWVSRVALAAWPGLALVEAVYVAVLGVGLAATSRLPGAPWWQALLWATVESVRSAWPLGGFPWLRLAHVTSDTPLTPLLPAVGVVGTSLAVALLGTSMAALVMAIARRRPAHVVGALAGPAVVAAGVALVLALLPAFADPEGDRAGEDLRVALVQGDTPGVGVQAMSVPRAVLENHVDATRQLAADVAEGREEPPDLVVWPENASDIDPFADAAAYAAISGAVAAVGAPALTGIVVGRNAEAAAQGLDWSNRVQLWDAGGEPGEAYDKRHGVPFGEYVPFRSVFTPVFPVLEQVPQDMRRGLRTGVLDVPLAGPGESADGAEADSPPPSDTLRVGVLICFEVADVELARDVVADGARVVAVPTNNATYMGTAQVRQQLQIARTTAMATRRPLLVAATNGLTALVDADGVVTEELRVQTSAVLTADVTPRQGLVPAVAHGRLIDRSVWLLASLGLLLALMRSRLSARARMRPSEGDTP